MKKVLILSSQGGPNSNAQRIAPELAILLRDCDIKVETDTYGSLEYKIVNQIATIYSSRNKRDIKDFDFVLPINWKTTPEQAGSCLIYLSKHKTPKTSVELINFRSTSKLTEYFKLWQENISIPNTIYSKNTNIIRMLKEEQLKFPLIVKDAFQHKGKRNFMAKDVEEVEKIIKTHKSTRFIFQEFIPNIYDYRIIAFGYTPKFAFKRERDKESNGHLNNTSVGGKATKVALSKIDPQIIREVEIACRSMKRSIAGADVLIDSRTKKHYFLEINAGPQLRTGSFAKEKMELYAEYLKEKLK